MNTEILNLVWKQFSERKLRTALTILGIVIGIAALISLIMLSSALKSGVTDQFDRFGSDTILVAPTAALGGGAPSGTGAFTLDDAEVIEQIPQIIEVNAFVGTTLLVEVGRERANLLVRGFNINSDREDSFQDFINLDILDGRYLQPGDYDELNVGYKFAKESFDKELFVGSAIEIEGKKFSIVGIFEEAGDQSNDMILVTSDTAVRDLLGEPKAVTAIQARVAPGADLTIVAERIRNRLERSRGAEDFGITTPEEIKNSINGLLLAVDAVVFSIAAISLFVASLGIMNSLYTSVLQRTKEIGTLKAVGARNSQILYIFIVESATLGFAGGVLGVLIGLGLALVFIGGFNTLGFVKLEISFNYLLFIGSILFSTALGILSGILPALRASKLKPVDALRHE